MPLKPFEKNDIFKNTLKTHPRFEFKIASGKVYLNGSRGNVYLNELNLNTNISTACSNANSFDFSCNCINLFLYKSSA